MHGASVRKPLMQWMLCSHYRSMLNIQCDWIFSIEVFRRQTMVLIAGLIIKG